MFIDYTQRSSEYWAEVHADIKRSYARSSDARAAWKQITQRRYAVQHPQKRWEDTLPSLIVKWAGEVFAELERTHDYMDNRRVARRRSSSQVRRYQKQRARGCCGFYDRKLVGPDGEEYLLGFNYGH